MTFVIDNFLPDASDNKCYRVNLEKQYLTLCYKTFLYRSQVDGCDIKLICSNGKMLRGNKDCNSLADDLQQIKDGTGGAATRITVNTQVIVLLSVILCILTIL